MSCFVIFRVFQYYFFLVFFLFYLEFELLFFWLPDKSWTLLISWHFLWNQCVALVFNYSFLSRMNFFRLHNLLVHPLLQNLIVEARWMLSSWQEIIDPQFLIYYMSWTVVIVKSFWHLKNLTSFKWTWALEYSYSQ